MDKFKVTTGPSFTSFDDSDEPSMLSLFDKDNPDKNLFNLVDDEIIKLSGSELLLFKYLPSDDIDPVYMESRQKTFHPTPIKLFGNYDPRPLEEGLSQFGVEVQNDQVFVFNKSYVERKVGRPIIIGDIIQTIFQNMKFEVFQVQEDAFEAYGIYHLMVHAKLLRDTESTHEENLDLSEPTGGILR